MRRIGNQQDESHWRVYLKLMTAVGSRVLAQSMMFRQLLEVLENIEMNGKWIDRRTRKFVLKRHEIEINRFIRKHRRSPYRPKPLF